MHQTRSNPNTSDLVSFKSIDIKGRRMDYRFIFHHILVAWLCVNTVTSSSFSKVGIKVLSLQMDVRDLSRYETTSITVLVLWLDFNKFQVPLNCQVDPSLQSIIYPGQKIMILSHSLSLVCIKNCSSEP